MAPGIYGADVAQLRSLSKSIGQSGAALQRIEATVNSVVGSAVWKGADGERFRSEWSSTLRPMLRNSSDTLRDQAKSLLAHADEQERTSTGSSGGGGSAASAGGAASGSPLAHVLDPVLDANGNPVYQVANAAASGAGLGADVLLSQMNKAGLLTRMPWSVLGAQYGQAPGLGYLKGTQLLNGLSMVGRAAGVLSIIGGTAQFADGMLSGDSNAMWDGGVSTVLAAGSFVPVVGPFFAGASLAWAGMGLLSKNLGYGSTSEMVVDGAKKVGSVIADGASAVADGAKKVWGWLGG
ncbi:WXG100 family type VII secretion target [Pseudarthrobacter sp. 1C304]|uniref:WXG100 family type VII secretion target n=1 Tax=Pseudarthrobacter sp. 1C304 TaxID=3457438 RepID=UPI003FD23702